MSSRTRRRQRVVEPSYKDISLREVEQVTDEDIELFLSEQDEEKTESIWNLPTIAGISTLAVGFVYLLQTIGIPIAPIALGGLVGSISVIAGILILLFGFGILSWRPKKNKVNTRQKTIGRSSKTSRSVTSSRSDRTNKTLRKSKNKKIAGVCAGIAEYFGIDPTIVRIGFVAGMFLFSGFTIPAYIVLAMILPKPDRPDLVSKYTTSKRQRDETDRVRIRRDR